METLYVIQREASSDGLYHTDRWVDQLSTLDLNEAKEMLHWLQGNTSNGVFRLIERAIKERVVA